MLKEAMDLAAHGLAIHWLHANSKRPIGNGWQNAPVKTGVELKRTYEKGYNVGFRPGEFSKVGDAWLMAVDLDIRTATSAPHAYAKLREMLPEIDIDNAPTVISGSMNASRHIYFLCEKPFGKKVIAKSSGMVGGKHEWLIEIMGSHSNLVLPPSIHPDTGKAYRWEREFDWEDLLGPIVVPAAALERAYGTYDDSPQSAEDKRSLGLSVEEVRGYLAALPNENLDYEDWIIVAAAVKHEAQGRTAEEAKEFEDAFMEWSKKSPKHVEKTAKYKFRSFKHNGDRNLATFRTVVAQVDRVVRDAILEEEFDDVGEAVEEKPTSQEPVKEAWDSPAAPKHVRYINKRHGMVRFKAKNYIVDFNKDSEEDEIFTLGDEKSLHMTYCDREERFEVTDENTGKTKIKMISWSNLWMKSPYRRFYRNGICFDPKGDRPGRLNLFQGWAVKPDPDGDCSLLIKHIENVLCNGVKEYYDAFLDFMAHMIQKPWERPTFALVMRGEMGAGKDTPFDFLGRILARHYITVGRNEDISGRFNAHMTGKILVHLQEGFYAGSREQQNYMRFILSGNTMKIEKKGVDSFSTKAYHRTVLSSNEDWVAPAAIGERRYFVLDVDNTYAPGVLPESRKRSSDYFGAIHDQMDNKGGLGKFMHYLMTRDISKFNRHFPPTTQALSEQIRTTLRDVDLWWSEVLESGNIATAGQGDTAMREIWERGAISKDPEELFSAYDQWRQSQKYMAQAVSRAGFPKKLRKVCASFVNEQVRVPGSSARNRQYRFGSLSQCRNDFARLLGSPIEWDGVINQTEDDL